MSSRESFWAIEFLSYDIISLFLVTAINKVTPNALLKVDTVTLDECFLCPLRILPNAIMSEARLITGEL